jgi:hypothetical protein
VRPVRHFPSEECFLSMGHVGVHADHSRNCWAMKVRGPVGHGGKASSGLRAKRSRARRLVKAMDPVPWKVETSS